MPPIFTPGWISFGPRCRFGLGLGAGVVTAGAVVTGGAVSVVGGGAAGAVVS
jgi:hypothetical protein